MKQFTCKRVVTIILAFILAVELFGLRSSSVDAHGYRPGICPITGTRIISREGKALDNYKIIWFELSNDSRMPVAVDKGATVTEEDFEMIEQHVRDGWEWEISRKKWSPERIQNYKDRFFGLKIKRIIE